ncbi:MAG: N-acetyltransferase [Anaerolineales bacterium]|nr:N-acetyltransferase [Anaerolineales bacterium]
MESGDWPSVRAIYMEGIATGNATFETSAPEWEEWDSKHLMEARLVAEADGMVVGWAALTPASGRCVYSGVAELSIYIASAMRGKGVGKALIAKAVEESEAGGFWTLRSGIFPENKASLALHQKFGFRILGTQERIGKMNGRWRDVVLMERRSAVVGN